MGKSRSNLSGKKLKGHVPKDKVRIPGRKGPKEVK